MAGVYERSLHSGLNPSFTPNADLCSNIRVKTEKLEAAIEMLDDDLERFEADGAAPLPMTFRTNMLA